MLVHFPIAWLIAAVLLDFVALIVPRERWPYVVATTLYVVGALSAFATYAAGRQAAMTVLTPGLAHSVVQQHWNWALATTVFFGVVASVRLALLVTKQQPSYLGRMALAGTALGGMILLFYTGELGARLVYEYGVGVSTAAGR